MTVNKKLFAAAQLTVGAVAYYTVPANVTTVIKKLTFTNTTAGAVTVTVYLGGAAADSTTIRKVRTIGPNDIYECFEAENHALVAGDTIEALCSAAASVTIMGTGIEIA